MKQTIICMKWGNRYSAEYVNSLWSMIQRNTKRKTELLCYTEDPLGLSSEIKVANLPAIELPKQVANRTWRKISLWKKTLEHAEGDVLFIDLDVVITGNIDCFFDHCPQSTFCVIENWTQPGSLIGNTSVYRFRVGTHPYIFEEMEANPTSVLETYPNSQTYISRRIREINFWPRPWCISFKHSILPKWPLNFIKTPQLPQDAKIVCFTGKPDPDEARDGCWPAPWYKKIYKHVRPTPWIAEHWR